MTKMFITWGIIAFAAIIMMFRKSAAVLGYLYCVGVGLAMAACFLYPFTEEAYEVMHCMTLGSGIGAFFGLFFALVIQQKAGMGAITGCLFILPILMFIAGFIIVLILGFGLMISKGDGAQVVTAGMVTWGMITGIIGSGGSILIIIFDN